MKRPTAIGHLVEMAEVATERMRLSDTDIGWSLEAMWVTGELLVLADTLEAGEVVLEHFRRTGTAPTRRRSVAAR